MLGLLTRTRRPRPAPRPPLVRLALELLEDRSLMAAPVITSFTATTLCSHSVQLSGTVTDENPATVHITFSGAVSGSTTADSSGHFSFTTSNAVLGNVQAVGEDQENLFSNTAQATVSSNPPQITNFVAVQGSAGMWTFRGQVTDECPAGLTVTFSGLPSVEGKTATVGPDGWFFLVVQLQPGEDGTVIAQTTDWWGLKSNEAKAIV